MNHELYTLALELVPGVGRKTIQKIYLDNNNNNINADFYMAIYRKYLDDINDIRYILEQAEDILRKSNEQNIKSFSVFNDKFPESLKSIDDFPIMIHIKGNINLVNEKNNVAIIGTREPSEHGMKITNRLSEIAVEKGYNVVSGLAIGTDRIAHQSCIRNGGKTIAVMPGGLDKVYPKVNGDLAEEILEQNGSLISEYYYGKVAYKGQYVERDRLQSALSKGIIVVETKRDGGSMHAIKSGLKNNRVIGAYNNNNIDLYKKNRSIISGNTSLIEEKKAIALSDPDSINYFFNELNSINLDEKERHEQINIYNTFKYKEKGIIFDLDQTMFDTKELKNLRNQRNWKKIYELIRQGKVKEYPNLLEIINQLKKNNVKIGIVTNSPKSYCDAILSYFNLDINYKICYHDVNNRKPDKEPMEKIMNKMNMKNTQMISIGDDVRDIVSSNNSGILSIAALWDSVNSREELEEAKPNYICENIYEFENILRKLEYI